MLPAPQELLKGIGKTALEISEKLKLTFFAGGGWRSGGGEKRREVVLNPSLYMSSRFRHSKNLSFTYYLEVMFTAVITTRMAKETGRMAFIIKNWGSFILEK